jgi:hypothetical protein
MYASPSPVSWRSTILRKKAMSYTRTVALHGLCHRALENSVQVFDLGADMTTGSDAVTGWHTWVLAVHATRCRQGRCAHVRGPHS